MRRYQVRCRRSFLSLRRATHAALLGLLLPVVAFAQANGKLQIHHVDVGQGDGILLISPLGQTALFDDGNYLNCTGIKTYLQGLGITTVNYHFLSHYHSDHLGCIDDLAAIGITIGTAGYDRGYSYSSGTYTAYVNTLGAKRTTIAKNQVITLDAGASNPVTIKCVDLNGAGVYSPSGSDENAKSAVYKVSYGEFNEIIGGDLTGTGSTDVETTVGPEVGDVEIYKVHHHGSQYSSNDNWLNAVGAEVGIIQTGNGNSYGHPTAAALGRLHAHNIHTYWTETGAGVSPDPSWDKVGGTIVVQAQPGVGASYTVAGSGFTDTWYNGGVAPIHTTEVAESVTLIKGSITVGDYTRLAVDDAVRMSISAGVEGGQYVTDWYGNVTLDHPPLNLGITYDGNYTVSHTQYVYLWNWNTSAWDQIQSGTVGTTDVTATWSTASPAAYVNASRQVRLRVRGTLRAAGSYTCRGDYMAFGYDYAAGTIASPITGLESAPVTVLASDGGTTAQLDSHAGHAPVIDEAQVLPQSQVKRLDATPSPSGVTLIWAVDPNAHVDGFNVYREDATGERVFAGNEATLENVDGEVLFRFVDSAPEAGDVYWLGSRSCSGPEGLIGPLRVAAAAPAATLSFAAAPNPAPGAVRFSFTLDRESDVRLDVYDLAGRRVATPFTGRVTAGITSVDWARRDDDGGELAAGVYFARLEGVGRVMITRVVTLER